MRRHMKKNPIIKLTIKEQPSTLATTAMTITNSSDSAGAFGCSPMFETIVSVLFPPLVVAMLVVDVEPPDVSSVDEESAFDDVNVVEPLVVVDVLDFGVTVVVVTVVVVGVVVGGRVVEPEPEVVDPLGVLVVVVVVVVNVVVVVVLGAGVVVVVVVRVTVGSSVVVGIATGMLEMTLSCDELSPVMRCRRGA